MFRAILTITLLGMTSVGSADDTFPELRKKFLESAVGVKKGEAAKQLIASAGPNDIQRWCFDKNDSVALLAAWRRVEVQMASRLVGSDRAANVIPIPAKIAREFLGFVEGRIRVPAPDRWSYNLLRAKYGRWGDTMFAGDNVKGTKARTAFPLLSPHLDGPDKPYLEYSADEAYEGKSVYADLPDDLAAKLKKARSADGQLIISGIASKDRAVIAVCGRGHQGDELICVPTRNRAKAPRVIWRARMDNLWAWVATGWSSVEFRLRDGILYLFHYRLDSIGIEAISLSDGSRRFSFNSRLPQMAR